MAGRLLEAVPQPVGRHGTAPALHRAQCRLASQRKRVQVYPSVYPERHLAVTRSTVFTSDRGQAVCRPKAVAPPDGVRQVEIVKLGRSRLISPAGHP
jgi:hypothetical protein